MGPVPSRPEAEVLTSSANEQGAATTSVTMKEQNTDRILSSVAVQSTPRPQASNETPLGALEPKVNVSTSRKGLSLQQETTLGLLEQLCIESNKLDVSVRSSVLQELTQDSSLLETLLVVSGNLEPGLALRVRLLALRALCFIRVSNDDLFGESDDRQPKEFLDVLPSIATGRCLEEIRVCAVDVDDELRTTAVLAIDTMCRHQSVRELGFRCFEYESAALCEAAMSESRQCRRAALLALGTWNMSSLSPEYQTLNAGSPRSMEVCLHAFLAPSSDVEEQFLALRALSLLTIRSTNCRWMTASDRDLQIALAAFRDASIPDNPLGVFYTSMFILHMVYQRYPTGSPDGKANIAVWRDLLESIWRAAGQRSRTSCLVLFALNAIDPYALDENLAGALAWLDDADFQAYISTKFTLEVCRRYVAEHVSDSNEPPDFVLDCLLLSLASDSGDERPFLVSLAILMLARPQAAKSALKVWRSLSVRATNALWMDSSLVVLGCACHAEVAALMRSSYVFDDEAEASSHNHLARLGAILLSSDSSIAFPEWSYDNSFLHWLTRKIIEDSLNNPYFLACTRALALLCASPRVQRCMLTAFSDSPEALSRTPLSMLLRFMSQRPRALVSLMDVLVAITNVPLRAGVWCVSRNHHELTDKTGNYEVVPILPDPHVTRFHLVPRNKETKLLHLKSEWTIFLKFVLRTGDNFVSVLMDPYFQVSEQGEVGTVENGGTWHGSGVVLDSGVEYRLFITGAGGKTFFVAHSAEYGRLSGTSSYQATDVNVFSIGSTHDGDGFVGTICELGVFPWASRAPETELDCFLSSTTAWEDVRFYTSTHTGIAGAIRVAVRLCESEKDDLTLEKLTRFLLNISLCERARFELREPMANVTLLGSDWLQRKLLCVLAV